MDAEFESKYIDNLIKEGKVEFLKEETNIKKAKFIGKLKPIEKCKNCNKDITLYDWEQPICNYCEDRL